MYGLRQDGRRVGELRDIAIDFGVVDADGSASFKIGNTHVVAFVHGPQQAKKEKDLGQIFCYFTTAHFAAIGERRRATRGDKKSAEFESNVKGMFESCVLKENIPHSDIEVHIVVLQDDGSVESASINAVSLALVDAGVPMKEMIVSCSSGYFKNTPLLDLTHAESSSFSVISEFRVAVLSRSQSLAYVNYDDIGGHKLTPEVVREVTEIAVEGCKSIHFLMRQKLLEFYQQI